MYYIFFKNEGVNKVNQVLFTNLDKAINYVIELRHSKYTENFYLFELDRTYGNLIPLDQYNKDGECLKFSLIDYTDDEENKEN